MRRAHGKGRDNILKRLLANACGFSLAPVMRKLPGIGKSRRLQGFRIRQNRARQPHPAWIEDARAFRCIPRPLVQHRVPLPQRSPDRFQPALQLRHLSENRRAVLPVHHRPQ